MRGAGVEYADINTGTPVSGKNENYSREFRMLTKQGNGKWIFARETEGQRPRMISES
jgi:hypothetical protein